MTGSALAHGHAGAGGRGKRGRRLPLPVARLRARMPETRNAVLRSGFGQPPSAPAATPPTAARIPACNAAQGEIKARQAGSMEHAASPGSKKKKARGAGSRARRETGAAVQGACARRGMQARWCKDGLLRPSPGPDPALRRRGKEGNWGEGREGRGREGKGSQVCRKPCAASADRRGASSRAQGGRRSRAQACICRSKGRGRRLAPGGGLLRMGGGGNSAAQAAEGRVPAKAPRGARGPLGKNGGPCPISAAVCWAIKTPRQARILGRTGGALPGRLSGGALPVRRPAPSPEPVYRPHPASPRAADRRGALK